MSALEDYYAMLDAETEKLLSLNNLGNSQQQWEQHVSGVGADVQGEDHVTGNQFLQAKGRIFAGGTGDTAKRDTSGNITGYVQKVKAGSLTPGLDRQAQMQADKRAGAPLTTASGTPGLDALHAMKPWSPATENPAYSVSVSSGNFAPGQSGFHSLAGGLAPAAPIRESWHGPTTPVPYGKYKSKYGDITVNTPAARTKQLADNLFL